MLGPVWGKGRFAILGVGTIMRCFSGTPAGTALLTVLLGCNVVAATGTPGQTAQRSADGFTASEQKALEAGVQAVI